MRSSFTFNIEMLRASYSYFAASAPFRRMNLPPVSEVSFKIIRDNKVFATHHMHKGQHVISVSSSCCGTTGTLMRKMAHEMCHVAEISAKLCTRWDIGHSTAFKKLALRVCKHHGFDPLEF